MNVKEIQEGLKNLGFYNGAIDGVLGPMSKNAIKEFQKKFNLDVDGIAGEQTQAELARQTRDVDYNHIDDVEDHVWPRQKDVPSFYGAVGQHQTSLVLPYTMYYEGKPVTKFSVHEKVHDSALECFEKIAKVYDEKARKFVGLDQFSGCLNVRKMRGGSLYSMHSWGIAIDFDAERNQFKWGKDRARLAKPDAEDFWKIWEAAGWLSLGRSRNFDWMHVQAARL